MKKVEFPSPYGVTVIKSVPSLIYYFQSASFRPLMG